MQAHQLKASKRGVRRIGRGGKRGSFSGRGIKGQKSRAGRHIRPQVRDILKKIHKRRGYGRNRGKSVVPKTQIKRIVTTASIGKYFSEGDHITLNKLIERGLAKKGQTVKILGDSAPLTKITFDQGLVLSGALRSKLGVKNV